MVKQTKIITSNAERCKKYREKQKLAKDQIEKNIEKASIKKDKQLKKPIIEAENKPLNLMNDEQGLEPSEQLRPQYEQQ
jgi:hypothetical protein